MDGFIAHMESDVYQDPIDWAIFTFHDFLKKKRPHIFYPSLFQHVGEVSTWLKVCLSLPLIFCFVANSFRFSCCSGVRQP
jgi:hypothetical protein